MLDFDEALRRVLADVHPLGTERVSLGDAQGRVLAETLTAATPMPAFDYSAMDGYAITLKDFTGDGPWSLPVRGESQTGHPAPTLESGAACRIFTGAVLPAGADAVVMQEDVERDGDTARFSERPATGQHVRRAGEDIERGAEALVRGTRLGPGQLGLAAALDRGELLVVRRPHVGIVCTGDELRAPGSAPRPGSIPESNGVALSAMVRAAGGIPHLAPLTRDDREATERALEQALRGNDVLLTVGGVSVGEHDLVRPALEAAGATLDFWKVAIKPGKPLVHGSVGKTRVLGLPGNPVSAQVTFALFGMPLLRALSGDQRVVPTTVLAALTRPLKQKPGRRGYYRAQLENGRVTPFDNQASGAPTSMAWANALAIVPADSTGFDAGASVDVLPLWAL